MLEVGWDLWRSSGPKPLFKQGHLQPAAQDCVSEDEDSTGKPVLVLGHPHCGKLFPEVQREPLVFQSVPIPSEPVTEHH